MSMTSVYLDDDMLTAERQLYRVLDETSAMCLYCRAERGSIDTAPAALGHSEAVTRILPRVERAGIVWNIRDDGMVILQY